jgi:hypothetical protein
MESAAPGQRSRLSRTPSLSLSCEADRVGLAAECVDAGCAAGCGAAVADVVTGGALSVGIGAGSEPVFAMTSAVAATARMPPAAHQSLEPIAGRYSCPIRMSLTIG